jgi:hypothetical protein
MGVREQLQKRPMLATALAAAVVLAAGCYIFAQWGDWQPTSAPPVQAFVSFDDGKTFEVAPADELPPFERDGKTALRAYVFACDGGKTKFVGYLERYSERGKELMREMRKQQASNGRPSLPSQLLEGMEIKRPGETEWVKQSDVSRAAKIMDVRCPNLPSQQAEMIFP